MKKRILAILLTVCMIASLLPAAALAAPEQEPQSTETTVLPDEQTTEPSETDPADEGEPTPAPEDEPEDEPAGDIATIAEGGIATIAKAENLIARAVYASATDHTHFKLIIGEIPKDAKTFSIAVDTGSFQIKDDATGFSNGVKSKTTSDATAKVDTSYLSVTYNGGSPKTALESLVFTCSSSSDVTVTISCISLDIEAGDIYLNGHIYQISSSTYYWDKGMQWAMNDTDVRTQYVGFEHYPATVTSAEENMMLVNFYTMKSKAGIWVSAVPKGQGESNLELVTGEAGNYVVNGKNAKQIKGATPGKGNAYEWIQGTPEAGNPLPDNPSTTVYTFWHKDEPHGGMSGGYNGPVWFGYEGAMWDDYGGFASFYGNNVSHYAVREYSPKADAEIATNTYEDTIKVGPSSTDEITNPPVDVLLDGNVTVADTTTASGIVTRVENGVVSIDPGKGESGTVTVKPNAGSLFTEDNITAFNNVYKNKGVTATGPNADGSVTLTFTKDYAGDESISFNSYMTRAEAKVGGEDCATVADALKKASEGENKTVQMQGSGFTAAKDLAVPDGVTLQDVDGNTVKGTGEGAKVSVDANGKLSVTGSAEVVLKDGKSATLAGTELSGVGGEATLAVTADGATLTGGSVSVPKSGAVTANGKAITNKGEANVTVTKGQPTADDAKVVVPDGATVEVDGKTYPGPTVLVINSAGEVSETGPVVEGLTVQRDDEGKIATNGEAGTKERLTPVFMGVDPGAVYYWRINGAKTSLDRSLSRGTRTIRDPDGGVWYETVADNDGTLTLNKDGSKTLVYGDYVEISGTPSHNDAVKYRLLSTTLLNGDFNATSGGWYDNSNKYGSYTPRSQIHGWRTTASNINNGNGTNQPDTNYVIEVLTDNAFGVTSGRDGQDRTMAELNAAEPASLYQEINTSMSKTFMWSLDYAGRGINDDQVMAVVIGPVKEDGEYQKPNNNSGTKDMFQDMVGKLGSYTMPAEGQMSGPITTEYNGINYTVWILHAKKGAAIHFSDTISTFAANGEKINEMVFAFTAIKPAAGANGNMMDNVMFQKPDPVYMVDGEPYATLKDALAAVKELGGDKDKTITITKPEYLGETLDGGTLPAGVTLVGVNGETYTTTDENGVELSVDSTGKVTVKGPAASADPEAATGGEAKVTVEPATGKSANFAVQGTTGAHDVEVSGKATVTVTEDASGNVTGATVAPETVTDPVTIDGVTYEAPTGSTGGEEGQAFAYDVDNPFAKAPDGTKATVPADKAKDTNFSLNVPGGTEGGFTVKPVDKGGEITVTKGNMESKTQSSITGGEVKGAVEVKSTPATDPEGTASDGKVNVNGVEYTVPAGKGSAKLGLVTKGTGEDGAKEDVVELLDGTVNVPNNGDIYVNKVDVENNGTGEITVTKDSPSEGKAQVDIPAETSVEIDGKPFIGEMSVVVDKEGKLSMAKGSTTLTGKELTEGKTEQSIDVTVSSPDGKSSGTVTVTNPSDNRSVEVKVPVSDDNPNGQATVQKGGSVKIGENEYTVPTDSGDKTYDDNNVFEFDSEGNVRIADGAVELADGQSVGFGSVELGNDETVNASGASKVTVEVVTPANGENRGEAKVTVPEGETFTVTVTDENGEKQTYTYKNNGEGELELTVDGDGKVSVKGSDLPENGLELGPDTPITVTGDNGAENNLVAGGKKEGDEGKPDFNNNGGATLKPNKKDYAPIPGSEVPLLESGSVCFPDDGGKVTVKDPTDTSKEKYLDGKNVEVFADTGNVKSMGNKGNGQDGEVKVEEGTKYYIPDGQVSEMQSGTFMAPAKGEIEDSKDGPGNNAFVLVPDKEGNNKNNAKLYSDNTDDTGESAEGAKESHVAADPGAGFDIREKLNGDANGDKNSLKTESFGHYEGTKGTEGAKLTVEHTQGTVTLTDGSVTMTKGEGEGSKDPSVFVGGVTGSTEGKCKVTGDDITVATTRDENGASTGADVTVPANGKVDIDGKTYENAGTGELELHIDDQGNVSVKSGSAKLGDGDAVKLGEATITGSEKDGEPNVTVTVPASDAEGDENKAKVTVSAASDAENPGTVDIGGKKYSNKDTTNELELTVDEKGNVELEKGAVTLPDPDSGEQKASVGVTAKGAGATGASKHYDVSGAGVTVTKDGDNNPTAKAGSGKSITVATGEGEDKQTTTYSVPSGTEGGAEVELTPTGPELKGGAVELDAASSSSSSSGKNESITVNGATVEATADGTPEGGKVTVKATTDETGKTTAEVDIPAGGKAKVNGVEITGEAKVTIDEDGSATVTPDAETGVVMDGKTYKKKDSADDNAKITIDKDGTINPEPAADFTIEITVPTTGPVHVGPGETVTFNDNGKTYTVTGGEEGGYFKVDKQDGGDCTITVTDKDGTPKSDAYKDAGSAGLDLTVDGEKAALTKGTVELADGESIGFGSAMLGNDEAKGGENNGIKVEVAEAEAGSRKAKVAVPAGETFTVTVTGEDGKSETYTYKNNGTGPLELEVDENGNVSVKTLPENGLELGPNTPITLTDAPDGKSNKNPLTAGAQGATLKPHTRVDDATDKVTANNPPLLESGSVIFPDKTLDEEGNNTTLGQVNVKDPLGGGVEKRLEGNNVEVFAGNTSVKAKGSNDPDGGIDGEVTVEKGTKYTIPAGETSELSNGTFKAPAKGEITENKDGPGSHPYVIVPDEGNTGLFTDDAATGADSKVFAEAGSGFELKQKRVESSSNKTESNLNPGSFGHYFGAEDGKGANVTVDHEQGTVTLTGGSLTMEKGAGTPNPEPSMYVQGIPEGSDENLKVTGDKVTVTKPRGNGSGADVTAENGEVTIGDKTYKNEAEGELGLYVDGNGNVGITKGEVTLTDKRGELPSIGVTAGSGEDIKDYEVSGEDVKIKANSPGNTKATVPAGGTLTVTDEDGNTNSYKNAGEGEMVVEFTENGPKLAEGSAELNVGEEIRVGNGGTEGADGTGTSVKNTGRGNITVNAGDDSGTKPSVDIPVGGSVELDNPNGCIEAEGKSVRVELNEDGTFSVELKPGDEVTINGRTYKNNDSKNGTIKVADDGTVTMDPEDVDIDESIKLPARNLKIPEGETYEYYVGTKKVEVKGGEGGGTVDIDRNGNVTGKDGNIEVRGDVKATVSPDAKTGTKVTQFGKLKVQVEDEDGTGVSGANVAVTLTVTDDAGNVKTVQKTTDANGVADFGEVPYGTYSVTVEKNDITSTDSVTVDAPEVEASANSVVLYGFTLNTKVESDLDVPPAVGNLDSVVTSEDKTNAQGADTNVEVTLTANALDEDDDPETTTELDSEATDEYGEDAVVTDYIDVTIVKTTTKEGEEPVKEPVTETKSLLTLSFKISGELADRLKDGVTAENIFVLRQHDGKTDKMRKVSESAGKRANYECYYIQTFGSDVYIVIRAQYFSVYAFGVASDAIRTNDPGSGSTGSGSGGAVTTGENVKVPTVENGAVTVTPKNAKAGETVTITPTPNDGYETGSVTVTDKNGNTVEVTDNGDGTYSFVMPKSSAQPVTVNVTFEKTQSAAERFEDIYGNEWYAEYVEYVVANGMMDGMSPTKFGPHIITNRGMIVTILYRLEGKPAVTKNIPFEDVAPGMYYTDAVIWAEQNGIITGYNEKEYGPEDPVTREQAAAILGRYARYKGIDITATADLSGYTDADRISPYAVEFMKWAVENKIIDGTTPTTLDPRSGSTRAMLATILTRYCREIIEK